MKKYQVVSFGERANIKLNKYFLDNEEIERTQEN